MWHAVKNKTGAEIDGEKKWELSSPSVIQESVLQLQVCNINSYLLAQANWIDKFFENFVISRIFDLNNKVAKRQNFSTNEITLGEAKLLWKIRAKHQFFLLRQE